MSRKPIIFSPVLVKNVSSYAKCPQGQVLRIKMGIGAVSRIRWIRILGLVYSGYYE